MDILIARTCKFCGTDISNRNRLAIVCEDEECFRKRDNLGEPNSSKKGRDTLEPAIREYLDDIAEGRRPSQLGKTYDFTIQGREVK